MKAAEVSVDDVELDVAQLEAELLKWHGEHHRSRALTEDEGRALELGSVKALGVRPNARMTIASRVYWALPPTARAALLEAAPADLAGDALEVFALSTLFGMVSPEVPEDTPADLVDVSRHVKSLLEELTKPSS